LYKKKIIKKNVLSFSRYLVYEGIGTLDRKMTSFRQSENIIAL